MNTQLCRALVEAASDVNGKSFKSPAVGGSLKHFVAPGTASPGLRVLLMRNVSHMGHGIASCLRLLIVIAAVSWNCSLSRNNHDTYFCGHFCACVQVGRFLAQTYNMHISPRIGAVYLVSR
jgi:hypothetical protein